MKIVCSLSIVVLLVVSMPINSKMKRDGKLEAHATAKKGKDGYLRCLAKSISDDIKIVNGWWGLSVQIDDQTWDRPTDEETPQYTGKTTKRLYKRERTLDDTGYSWAYISGVWTNGTGFYASAYDSDITK